MPANDPDYPRYERGSWEHRAIVLGLKTGIFWKWWNEDYRAIGAAEQILGLGIFGTAKPVTSDEDTADT